MLIFSLALVVAELLKHFCDFLLNKSINTLLIVDTNIDTLVVNDTDLKNFSYWEG